MKFWVLTAIPEGESLKAQKRGEIRKSKLALRGIVAQTQRYRVKGQIVISSNNKEDLEEKAEKLRQKGYVTTIKRWKAMK